jgi:transposase
MIVTQQVDGSHADGARGALWKQYRKLHDLVVKFVSRSELCQHFMAIPGVGPVTALSFVTAIDDPS